MTHPNNLNAPAVNDPTPPTPPYGSGMDQVCSGPAALLYTLSNELIAIYSELQALYQEMTKDETSAQKDMIDSGANAQRAAASQQAWAIGCEAIGSAVGGAISGATAIATQVGNKDSLNELGGQEEQLKNLQSLDKMSQNVALKDSNVVVTNSPMPEAPDVEARALELKNGDYASTQFKDLNEKQMADLNEAAMAKLKQNNQLNDVRANLQTKIKMTSEQINNIHSQMQVKSTKYQNISQFASNFANAGAKAGQAGWQAAAGDSQATQQVNQGVNQLAQSTAETTRQNIGKYYDAVAGLIAAARQGAQAYAQT